MPITFDAAVKTCAALGQFADAREKGDKDVILMVEKVDGRESLKTIRISELAWQQRIIRYMGFYASLGDVSTYLKMQEPRLPPKFNALRKDAKGLWNNYSDESSFQTLQKKEFQQMKENKFRGMAQLIGCMERHLKAHPPGVFEYLFGYSKVSVPASWKDEERINLAGRVDIWFRPIGLFSHESPKLLKTIYRFSHPEFLPNFSNKRIAGFCYEYGIGIEKDLPKARAFYAQAVEQIAPFFARHGFTGPHFADLINLARVTEDKASQIALFTEANAQLQSLIGQLETGKAGLDVWIGKPYNPNGCLKLCKTTQEKVAKELAHLA